MLVSVRMTANPVTVDPNTGIDDALHLMRERKVRRLPVVDAGGHVIGIVSDKDLLLAAPSPATSLSVYELHYLLSKLTVQRVMSSPVVTVAPDTPLEEAARIMADRKIGGLPVMEGQRLVGIITETDIFRALVDVLGARESGLRVTLKVSEAKGVLAQLTRAIADSGGNIISLVTSSTAQPSERLITFKVSDVNPEALRTAISRLQQSDVVDFRQV